MPNTPVQYAADLNNVKEVTLHGTADLSFWEAVLHKERLFPYQETDKAVLLLSATQARWKGLKFREFIISVAVCLDKNGTRLEGYYLPAAFNTSKLLAFSERVFFRTPYLQADIQLQDGPPVSIRLQDRTETLLHAELSVPDTQPITAYQAWKGPVFLPNNSGKFFVVLAGETVQYPFSPATDRFELSPSARHGIFQQLIESNFIANLWSLRSNARHARSKTYEKNAD